MAALEAVILYIQLTLGIANPTSTDVQRASSQMHPTGSTYVTAPVLTSGASTTGWDINEGN